MYESPKRQRHPVRADGAKIDDTGTLSGAEKYTRQSLVAQAGAAICHRILSGTIDGAQARRETAALTAAVELLKRLRGKRERPAPTNDLFAQSEAANA
ncbi:MAG: hypothetical protein QM741_00820 [Rudaea sp.]|uniref:hypothetical protein n=1 Tax=Rudaea sp. TaxID=2136325 RepID=UPI0039E27C59